jgi:hypothetical protein
MLAPASAGRGDRDRENVVREFTRFIEGEIVKWALIAKLVVGANATGEPR